MADGDTGRCHWPLVRACACASVVVVSRAFAEHLFDRSLGRKLEGQAQGARTRRRRMARVPPSISLQSRVPSSVRASVRRTWAGPARCQCSAPGHVGSGVALARSLAGRLSRAITSRVAFFLSIADFAAVCAGRSRRRRTRSRLWGLGHAPGGTRRR